MFVCLFVLNLFVCMDECETRCINERKTNGHRHEWLGDIRSGETRGREKPTARGGWGGGSQLIFGRGVRPGPRHPIPVRPEPRHPNPVLNKKFANVYPVVTNFCKHSFYLCYTQLHLDRFQGL